MGSALIRPASVFGPHIRSLRLARGDTGKQLDRRVRPPLQQIEQGDFNPGMRALYNLCDELDISFSTLVVGLCRQVQGSQGAARARAAELTPDQRRAALFGSGQLARCEDDTLTW